VRILIGSFAGTHSAQKKTQKHKLRMKDEDEKRLPGKKRKRVKKVCYVTNENESV
jgi:hypothetical protein